MLDTDRIFKTAQFISAIIVAALPLLVIGWAITHRADGLPSTTALIVGLVMSICGALIARITWKELKGAH